MTPELAGKTLVGFGASIAAASTLAGTGLKPAFFVDGNPAFHGDQLAGMPVRPPDAIAEWLRAHPADDLFVIVFAWGTRAVRSIFTQLEALGLERERHFTDCSVLQFEPMAEQLAKTTAATPEPDVFRAVRGLALSSELDNRSSIAGTWLIQQLLRHQLSQGDGDVAEAGVYKGGSALMTLELLGDRIGDRGYHLFDSFEGLPELSALDPASRAGEFADVSASGVRAAFERFPQARIHAGMFADTFDRVADREFCFVYVDCDLYEPARECAEFFFDRLTAGGVMLFHDYWVDMPAWPLPDAAPEPFTGIRLAVDELSSARGVQVIRFPQTTHALISAS